MEDRLRETTLPAAPTSVRTARSFVSEALGDFGFAALIDEAVLVVSELATNAVLHAGTPFSLITDCRAENAVLLSLRDWSSRFPVWTDADGLDDHGRGLRLVDSLSSSWGVTAEPDGGKTVWASLDDDRDTRHLRGSKKSVSNALDSSASTPATT